MDSILAYYNEFIILSKNNPIVAGLVGVYFGGVLTYLSRNLPSNIMNFIKRQFTVELIIDKDGNHWDTSQIAFENFTFWAQDVKKYFSRTFVIGRMNDEMVLSSGLGIHIFIYKKRLFWYSIIDLESSGSSIMKKRVVLNTLGRSRTAFDELLSEFKDIHKDVDESVKRVYTLDGYWIRTCPIPKRTLDYIFINENELKSITDDIDAFINNKDTYDRLGIPYRYTLMLEGPTGTGKTSIIKGLANKYNRNIYIVKPQDLLKKGFIYDMTAVNNGFLVIEDIDSLSSISSRGNDVNEDSVITEKDTSISRNNKEVKDSLSDAYEEFFKSDLSTILNTLDGVVEINNLIIIMTTNKIESIDKAMLRPGRVDRIHHIGWLDRDTIVKSCVKLTGLERSLVEDKLLINYISGAELMNKYMLRKDDYHFIDSINSVGIK